MALQPPRPGSLAMRLWRGAMGGHVALYRLTGGRIGGRYTNGHPSIRKGEPVLLLDHVGRKSGKRRTNPLVYMPDGDDLVLVASRGGTERHPAWFHNLKANPRTTVQVGREKREVVAKILKPKEKQRLWPGLADFNQEWAEYGESVERDIPVVVLSRA